MTAWMWRGALAAAALVTAQGVATGAPGPGDPPPPTVCPLAKERPQTEELDCGERWDGQVIWLIDAPSQFVSYCAEGACHEGWGSTGEYGLELGNYPFTTQYCWELTIFYDVYYQGDGVRQDCNGDQELDCCVGVADLVDVVFDDWIATSCQCP